MGNKQTNEEVQEMFALIGRDLSFALLENVPRESWDGYLDYVRRVALNGATLMHDGEIAEPFLDDVQLDS